MSIELNEQPRKRGTPRWMRNLAIIAVSVEATLTVIWLLWRAWQKRKQAQHSTLSASAPEREN